MSQRFARVGLACLVIALASLAFQVPATSGSEKQEAEAVIARFRELLANTETKRVVVPFPDSRSRILAADGSSDFFLYIERGNLRGTEAINAFYDQLGAGDTNAAYETFVQHSLVSMRISDFGWNGLGVPMTTESGNDIADRFFKNSEGMFGPAEPSADDASLYLEYIETILIPAISGGADR